MDKLKSVNPNKLDAVHVDGVDFPYINMGQVEPAIKLVLEGSDYWYARSLPTKGYSAVLKKHIQEIQTEDENRKILLARFWNRIYIYSTDIKPIGSGKPPGG